MAVDDYQYTSLEMEAALCVWEELLERTSDPQMRVGATFGDQTFKPERDWREAHGSVAMRLVARAIGAFALQVYDKIGEELLDGIAYDWEFIPAVVNCVVWDCIGAPAFPSVLDAAWSVTTALQDLIVRLNVPRPS